MSVNSHVKKFGDGTEGYHSSLNKLILLDSSWGRWSIEASHFSPVSWIAIVYGPAVQSSIDGHITRDTLISIVALGQNLERIRRVPQLTTQISVSNCVWHDFSCSSQGRAAIIIIIVTRV